ncbi:restriction endonuclease [Lentzea sp. NPDC058436]|uniref:restriction endonuclease n=1 Tax=Lentzea sp. NPDC058436 TaxID=3346499 RepID=UPI00364C0670
MARAGQGSSSGRPTAAQLAREAQRRRAEVERQRVAKEKEQKRLQAERGTQKAERKTAKLERRVEELGQVLTNGLARSAVLDWNAYRMTADVPPLDLGELATPVREPQWHHYAPREPGLLSQVFGGQGRHQRRLSAATLRFEEDTALRRDQEAERQRHVVEARKQHANKVHQAEREARDHNNRLDAVRRGVQARQQTAVEQHLSRVLASVPLPRDFPRHFDLTYNPHSEQVVVRLELPPRHVVPSTASYRYLPTKDEERPTPRKPQEVGAIYRSLVSQVALLCLRDLFSADPALSSIGFNGHVHAVNPATGEQEFPCLVSLDVVRDSFPKDDNLRRITPEACIRHLNAIVSNHPYELEPIEPILDFDLSKYSFVEGLDAVSTLDSRPDLMEMSPSNFEHLVRQIFEARGAEGWTTEQSKDDGVDAVIARRTPLFGGLSIVQAKRYSRVVGVNHIRELAGAMEEKKAGWGVLVTTSWFASGCRKKALEHGRMELIDGPELVHLIKQHLGKDVLINIPNRPNPQAKHGRSAKP